MCKWEYLGLSKEMFEACEELAKAGLIREKIEKCCVEKADISELKCNEISKGNVDSFITIVEGDDSYSVSTTNKDSINLKVNNIKNEKSVYQQVLECVTNKLSNDLWQTFEEAEDEEILCLECLVRYYLEKSYSEGYKKAVKYMVDRLDETNKSLRDELLYEVAELGYGDDE